MKVMMVLGLGGVRLRSSGEGSGRGGVDWSITTTGSMRGRRSLRWARLAQPWWQAEDDGSRRACREEGECAGYRRKRSMARWWRGIG